MVNRSFNKSQKDLYRACGCGSFQQVAIYTSTTKRSLVHFCEVVAMLLACGVQYVINILENWFPLWGERAHALYIEVFKNKIERGGGWGSRTTSTDYNILHGLQVHHLSVTIIIQYKNILTH